MTSQIPERVCTLCGSEAAVTKVDRKIYYDCGRCGFISLAPECRLPLEAERERYLLHRNDPADRGYRRYLQSFADVVVEVALRGDRILDFGSGPTPVLATMLEETGFDMTLYDPFFAQDASTLSETYPCVVAHESAEHFASPRVEFARIGAAIQRPGVLLVRTRFAPEHTAEFAQWWYRQDSTHVGFFRRRTFGTIHAILVSGSKRDSCISHAPPDSARTTDDVPSIELRDPDIAIIRLGNRIDHPERHT